MSGEGGPLLLADHAVVLSWRGCEAGGADYDRACTLLEERPPGAGCGIEIGGGAGLLWQMGGPGTAHVFRRGHDHVVVVRTWLEDPRDRGGPRALAEAPATKLEKISELAIPSGVLAILWAPEDGQAFESLDSDGLPMGEMSMGGTGLTLALAPGAYDCFQDPGEISTAAGDARRCHLIRRTT